MKIHLEAQRKPAHLNSHNKTILIIRIQENKYKKTIEQFYKISSFYVSEYLTR